MDTRRAKRFVKKSKLPKATRSAPEAQTPALRMEHLADDFNHVFTVMLGLAELAAVRKHIRGDVKLHRYIEEIRRSGLGGLALVRQLVAEARDCESRLANGDSGQPVA